MSKSWGKRHGGKITRILLGIDESYQSTLEGAVRKGGRMGLLNAGGRGFSAKKPNAKLEGKEKDGETKIIVSNGVWGSSS